MIPTWLCAVLHYAMRFGRMCIAYNSLFVAFVRFLYIVYRQKANQWNFERIGRRFQIASIAIPVVMETICVFTSDLSEYTGSSDRFKDCVESYEGSNSTTENVRPPGFDLTMRVLPEPLVLTISYIYTIITMITLFNIPEAFLYLKIFQSMKRYLSMQIIVLYKT